MHTYLITYMHRANISKVAALDELRDVVCEAVFVSSRFGAVQFPIDSDDPIFDATLPS